MFVLINNLDYRRRKVLYYQQYGTNRLRDATHANSFTFILLHLIVPLLSLIQLIGSTNLHPNNTQAITKHKEVPQLTEKTELICISDRCVAIGAIP